MNRYKDIPFFHKKAEEVYDLLSGGRLFAYRDDGLFARLSCFANAIRVSRTLNLPAPVGLWESGDFGGNLDHGYRESFSEVFGWGESIEVREAKGGAEGAKTFTWPFLCVIDEEDPGEVLHDLATIVGEIQIRSPYCEPVNEALDELRSWGPGTGVHCRAGDVEDKIEWMFRKGYPTSFWGAFFRQQGRAEPDSKFYVASNSVGLRAKAAEYLGDRVRTVDDFISLGDIKQSQLVLDYADNLLFAQSVCLVGCGFSSFVAFACMRSEVLPTSPLEKLPDELSEAYVDLNNLWKCRYLSDVSHLIGYQLEHSPIAEQLRSEGYELEEDQTKSKWTRRFQGVLRRLRRTWLSLRGSRRGENRLHKIHARFFRFSRW
ncbi:MAG: hypothetical protein AAGJ81_11710 [Verrucomicrobiota bacterium]